MDFDFSTIGSKTKILKAAHDSDWPIDSYMIQTPSRELKTEQKGCDDEKSAWVSPSDCYNETCQKNGGRGRSLAIEFEATTWRGKDEVEANSNQPGYDLVSDKLMWKIASSYLSEADRSIER